MEAPDPFTGRSRPMDNASLATFFTVLISAVTLAGLVLVVACFGAMGSSK